MMLLLGSYVRRWRRMLRRVLMTPWVRQSLQLGGYMVLGFCLSAASLGSHVQPLCLAVLCAGLLGWEPVAFATGGALGYWLFWGSYGMQGIVWIAAGLPVCVLLSSRKQEQALLMPSIAALIVASCGVLFQSWQDDSTSIAMYLLRIGMAFGSTWLVAYVRNKRDTAADWVVTALGVLALAQIAPLRFLNLGIVAGSMLVSVAPFPAVALAGLALDLAQVTPVPMTAVLCVASLLRLLPWLPRGTRYAVPAIVYILVMGLCGAVDLQPLAALFAGGILGSLLPKQTQWTHRRGETGFAQVRLEMVAQVLEQSEQLLQETLEHPIDEGALIGKAAERACSTCPCRKGCKELERAEKLPEALLHRPLISADDVPVDCKKRGRLMLELRRAQDQYRILKADRDRQEEYRNAVIQQYHFLSEYLQALADTLPKRGSGEQRFQAEVAVCSTGKEMANGDRCMWFAGTENRCYMLLCDGMGTGQAAAAEARVAGDMLRRLLMVGYPAPYALRSLNSMCVLRGKAGAVTVDLAEVRLDSGKVTMYKWGAAPSWLLLNTGAERIGAFGPPPGLSVTDCRETVDKLSLRRGETLVLVSDGVNAGAICTHAPLLREEPAGSMAAKILELGSQDGADDATAAVIRLMPIPTQQG